MFLGNPVVSVTRMIEENDIVVAEGTFLTKREDGASFPLALCDVFEMENGKIRRLTSYLMEIAPPALRSGA